MKLCKSCNTEKELTEFHTNPTKKDGVQSMCKECRKEYHKEHYLKNRDKYIRKARIWRDEEKDRFINFLKGKFCMDCGIDNIIVLEFDHRGNKEFDISKAVGKLSLENLQEEINKCDIVCSNCHKIRTAKQFGWRKAV